MDDGGLWVGLMSQPLERRLSSAMRERSSGPVVRDVKRVDKEDPLRLTQLILTS